MKKFLKILGYGAAGILLLAIAVGFFIFHRLPSAAAITSQFKSREVVKPEAATESTSPIGEIDSNNSVSGDSSQASIDGEEDDEGDPGGMTAEVVSDLVSPLKPLSDFCPSLKNAKDGVFAEEDFKTAFDESLNLETQDPRIQAVKPVLRYVMRLPKMTDMINEAQAAADRNDEGFVEKAEFYAKAYSAFNEMNEHKTDIESVMDRSYLLLGLNKLIAKKPELQNDPRIRNYCGGVETSFNQSRPVDFENEKKDFLKVLNDVNVNPKEIGFDSDYKSAIHLDFSGQGMTFEGGWLSDLVKSDVDVGSEAGSTN